MRHPLRSVYLYHGLVSPSVTSPSTPLRGKAQQKLNNLTFGTTVVSPHYCHFPDLSKSELNRNRNTETVGPDEPTQPNDSLTHTRYEWNFRNGVTSLTEV